MRHADFIVIGAGIAGISAAFELSRHGTVLLLERESGPGFHSTAKSAAIGSTNFETETVQALGRASKSFFERPPGGFCEDAVMGPLQILWLARDDQKAKFEQMREQARRDASEIEEISAEKAIPICPILRKEYLWKAFLEHDAYTLDVYAIQQGFLKGLRERGGEIVLNAAMLEISRNGKSWNVKTSQGDFESPIIVNAAGAWCDSVAQAAGIHPIGIRPLKRSIFTLDAPTTLAGMHLPFVYDIDEQFYFKFESGRILVSPSEEVECHPADTSCDDYEIAVGADRFEKATTIKVSHIKNKWAGFRNFASDREFVIGADPEAGGFFWLAGQGGAGIMTAPAAAQAVTSLITGNSLPQNLIADGLKLDRLTPARFKG